jgi:hypothetical protein
MKRALLFAVALMLIGGMEVWAQSGAGTWAGEVTGRGGAQNVTVMLSADGTGTFKQGEAEAETLSEVTLDGNTVSFSRTPNFGGRGGFTLTYTGTVEGNTLTLNVEGGGGRGGPGGGGGRGAPMPITLTRQ